MCKTPNFDFVCEVSKKNCFIAYLINCMTSTYKGPFLFEAQRLGWKLHSSFHCATFLGAHKA